MGKQAKHKRMQRAAYRSMQRNKDVMWRRLSDTENKQIRAGYMGAGIADAPMFYCPYIPIVTITVA